MDVVDGTEGLYVHGIKYNLQPIYKLWYEKKSAALESNDENALKKAFGEVHLLVISSLMDLRVNDKEMENIKRLSACFNHCIKEKELFVLIDVPIIRTIQFCKEYFHRRHCLNTIPTRFLVNSDCPYCGMSNYEVKPPSKFNKLSTPLSSVYKITP